jgi:hypothetical protein
VLGSEVHLDHARAVRIAHVVEHHEQPVADGVHVVLAAEGRRADDAAARRRSGYQSLSLRRPDSVHKEIPVVG